MSRKDQKAHKTIDPRREYCLPTRCVSPINPNTEENERVCLSISIRASVSSWYGTHARQMRTLEEVDDKHDRHDTSRRALTTVKCG
jgi:hypothetical protein